MKPLFKSLPSLAKEKLIKLIFSLLLIIISSCSNPKEQQRFAQYKNNFNSKISLGKFIPEDTINIKTHNLVNTERFVQYFKDNDDKTFFYSNSIHQNTIQLFIYGLNDDYYKILSFEIDGPNGIGNQLYESDILINNWDSIFILSRAKKIVFLTDSSKSKFISFKCDLDLELWGNNYVPIAFDPILKKLCLFSNTNILPWQREYSDTHQDVIFDINRKKFSNQIPDWPKGYRDTKKFYTFYGSKYSRTYNSNKRLLVYSFFLDSKLYLYSLESENFVASIEISDSHYYGFPPPPDINMDEKTSKEEQLEYANSYPQYYGINYDPFKKCYYRFVRLPTELKTPEGILIEHFDRPIAVQAIDSNGLIISEMIFPGKKINVYNKIISKEGLWLSTNTIKGTNYDEDSYTFICFRIDI